MLPDSSAVSAAAHLQLSCCAQHAAHSTIAANEQQRKQQNYQEASEDVVACTMLNQPVVLFFTSRVVRSHVQVSQCLHRVRVKHPTLIPTQLLTSALNMSHFGHSLTQSEILQSETSKTHSYEASKFDYMLRR